MIQYTNDNTKITYNNTILYTVLHLPLYTQYNDIIQSTPNVFISYTTLIVQ